MIVRLGDKINRLVTVTSTNISQNSVFDKLFDQVSVLPNGDEKYRLMSEMDQVVREDTPWIMLYYNRSYFLVQKPVVNFRYSSFLRNILKYVAKN